MGGKAIAKQSVKSVVLVTAYSSIYPSNISNKVKGTEGNPCNSSALQCYTAHSDSSPDVFMSKEIFWDLLISYTLLLAWSCKYDHKTFKNNTLRSQTTVDTLLLTTLPWPSHPEARRCSPGGVQSSLGISLTLRWENRYSSCLLFKDWTASKALSGIFHAKRGVRGICVPTLENTVTCLRKIYKHITWPPQQA